MSSNSKKPAVTEGSVSRNLRALREGSERTQEAAWEKLFPGLNKIAHRMAHARLRGTGDDSEVAGASAARRTLEDIQTGKVNTTNRQQLYGLLGKKGQDKVAEVLRKSSAKMRDRRVTDSLGDVLGKDEGGTREFEIPAQGHEKAILKNDLLERLKAKLPEECRPVVTHYLKCLTQAAIGKQLGIGEDTVGRRIGKIKEIGAQIVAES